MEIIEHVEDINFFLESCSSLLRKKGIMFIATINKTLKSYLFAIVGAEYILRWLPIGTHEWDKFVNPEDLINISFQDPSIHERTISLIDFKGVLINKYSSRDKEVAIDLSTFSEGIYLLNIVEGSVCLKRKIMKI